MSSPTPPQPQQIEVVLQAELPDEELRGEIHSLIKQVISLQDEFEESLLDQELWTSVDLLQNVGIQHRQFFGGLDDKVRETEVTADELKRFVRQGRTAFSEWLFDRFKTIATQDSPTQGAVRAFDELFSRIDEICGSQPGERVIVSPEPGLFLGVADDSVYVRTGKLVKRLLRHLGKRRFPRRFSPRELALYHLGSQLGLRLLRIAQMLGEAEFFLLRRVKGLYEEIEQAYNGFLDLLDREGGQPNVEELVSRASLIGTELNESFRLVGAEVMKYYDEIRRLLESEIRGELVSLIAGASRVGTVQLPTARLRLPQGEVERRRRSVRERLKLWGRYQVGFIGSYTMGLEMVRLQNQLRHAVDETVLKVNSRLCRQLEEQYQKVREKVEAAAGLLREARDSDAAIEEVRGGIEKERTRLLEFLTQEVQENLRSIEGSAEINQLIDLLMERFRKLADGTVESFQIVEEEDLPGREGEVPEEGELKIAPVRAVVRAYLEGGLTHRLGDVNGIMLGQVRELETGIEELLQSAGFSLGNVVVELREVGKSPTDLVPVALSRLQRALEGFQGHYQKVLEGNKETEERVVKEVADTARLLRQLVLEETVREMRRKIENRKEGAVRRRLRGLRQTDLSRERRRPAEKEKPSEPIESLPQREEEIAEGEAGRAEALDYEGILDLEGELSQRVPFAYRRLFRTTPLEVSEFLAGRSGALGTIETACRRWRQERFSSVVIIGEQGSGKTSLINCAMEQKLKGLPLVRHRIDKGVLNEGTFVQLLNGLLDMQGTDLADLERKIADSHERRIVLLEDLHRLHLRALGGLGLLKRFLEFIDATGGNILWLISIEQAAWQYLDHIQKVSRHFAFRIETGHLSRQELEGAIMARHRATGYRLGFTPAEGGREEGQESLRRAFFDRLNRASGGNVFSAIFYWLRSVEGVEGDLLKIKPLEELRLEFLQALPLNELVYLAMIVQHGGLTAEDFTAIFRIPQGEGRTRLTHLERLGVLKREGEIYVINQILYHPIVTQLQKRNLFK
jgi:hypothetical protein